MLPAFTCSPPNTLTPRRCEFESRPLRVEPPPFLCAMGLSLNRGDLDGREVLPVTVLALVALAPPELEHDEPLAAIVLEDLCLHLRPHDGGFADLRCV